MAALVTSLMPHCRCPSRCSSHSRRGHPKSGISPDADATLPVSVQDLTFVNAAATDTKYPRRCCSQQGRLQEPCLDEHIHLQDATLRESIWFLSKSAVHPSAVTEYPCAKSSSPHGSQLINSFPVNTLSNRSQTIPLFRYILL